MATREEIRSIFPSMVERFLPEKATGVKGTILFDLSGDNGGQYWIRVADGAAEWGDGAPADASVTVKTAGEDWFAVSTGQMNPMQAFMTGKIKIVGDMGLAMKMQTMFRQ